MHDNISYTKEFEVLSSEDTSDGYMFGGYILTFNNILAGHRIKKDSTGLIIAKDANLSFRKDSRGEINLPLTVNHQKSIGDVVGNFVSVVRDSVGYFGRAVTKDPVIAEKIKNRTLRNMSSELRTIEFTTENKLDMITLGTFDAVSLVSVPADSQATIIEFSSKDNETITNYSDYLRNLGLSNKKANIFISKFKEFLLQEKDSEILLLNKQLNKYKLLEGLRNGK